MPKMSSTLKFLRALSDPTRLRIVALLEKDELSVNELQEITRMGQSRISTHLALLLDSELVHSRREGKRTFYRLNPQLNGTSGEFVELASNVRVKLDAKQKHNIDVVVDRLVIEEKIRVRLSDSVETSLKWGGGRLLVLRQPPEVHPTSSWSETLYSNGNYSPATGQSFETPTPKHFSFNSPAGACPVCHGLGQKLVFDETLVVPDAGPGA